MKRAIKQAIAQAGDSHRDSAGDLQKSGSAKKDRKKRVGSEKGDTADGDEKRERTEEEKKERREKKAKDRSSAKPKDTSDAKRDDASEKQSKGEGSESQKASAGETASLPSSSSTEQLGKEAEFGSPRASWNPIGQLDLAATANVTLAEKELTSLVSPKHSRESMKRESIFGVQRIQPSNASSALDRRDSVSMGLYDKQAAMRKLSSSNVLENASGSRPTLSNSSDVSSEGKFMTNRPNSPARANSGSPLGGELQKKSSFLDELQRNEAASKDKRKSDILGDFRSKSHAKLEVNKQGFGLGRLGKKERVTSGAFDPSKLSLEYPKVQQMTAFDAVEEVIDTTSYSGQEADEREKEKEKDREATLETSQSGVVSTNSASSLNSSPSEKSDAKRPSEKKTKTKKSSKDKKKEKEAQDEEKSKQETTRKFIAKEMLSTEKSYYESLCVCLNFYQKPLMAKASLLGVTEQKVQSIFGTWETIVNFHEKFHAKLEEVVRDWDVNPCMGDVFCILGPGLCIYADYAELYAENFQRFLSLEKKNSKFKAEVDACYTASKHSLRINDLLILPVQRIPRYVLLLSDLIKNTSADHEDHPKLLQGLKILQEMATLVNERVRKRDHDVRLQELVKEGIDLTQFLKPTTIFIRDGVTKVEVKKIHTNNTAVSAKDPSKDQQHWFLFSDLFIHVPKQNLKQVKEDFKEYAVPLALCWISPATDNKKNAYVLRTPSEEIYFNDPEWESIFQQSIESHLQIKDSRLLKYYENFSTTNRAYRVGEYYHAQYGTYVGQYFNGNRHGKGKWLFRGNTYKGEWANDSPTGKGRFRYSTGGICIGTWKNGLQDGDCRLRLIDGTTFIGKWVDGVRHGHGVIEWPNKDSYQGNWKKDRMSGFGRLTCKSGLIYIGNWKKNMFHGVGRLLLASGISYEGQFERGLRNGRGKIRYADGSWYIGSFENGIRNGSGIYSQNKGDSYYGNFQNDFYDGYGELNYANGSSYEGEWKRGKRSGNGRYHDVQYNAVYDGNWADDMKHGAGVYTTEGTTYTGTWEKDKMESSFTVTYADGSKFDGIYSNGVKVKGKYTGLADKSILTYDGEWKGGMVTGKGILTLNSGKTFKGAFEHGTCHGNVVINHAIGTEKSLYESVLFSNDVRDGQITISCLTEKMDEVTGTCTNNNLQSPQGYTVPIEPSNPCWSRSLQTSDFT